MYEAIKINNIETDNTKAGVKRTDFKMIFFMRFSVLSSSLILN